MQQSKIIKLYIIPKFLSEKILLTQRDGKLLPNELSNKE